MTDDISAFLSVTAPFGGQTSHWKQDLSVSSVCIFVTHAEVPVQSCEKCIRKFLNLKHKFNSELPFKEKGTAIPKAFYHSFHYPPVPFPSVPINIYLWKFVFTDAVVKFTYKYALRNLGKEHLPSERKISKSFPRRSKSQDQLFVTWTSCPSRVPQGLRLVSCGMWTLGKALTTSQEVTSREASALLNWCSAVWGASCVFADIW